ncbi:thioredoxin-dependent thiol peroxidase [Gallaecimonas kandeliae]|uniref:thioredoxin-dependent thiol peroxidase n=1 Tax=Gallaecimonas kandeliae TaxID=3029055 RepID=UPI002649DF5E|nr:thioredoxin-dependent thiol peroxidase [Gallaecimonas kandeliae]WKE67455.1 thioredoxin-dependent thiol peroxidase [Gallaecimonas kandeliae]
MQPLGPGDKAPAFDLRDQDGNPVRLGDFAGRQLLVYFYPKASTPGCTVQACGLRDSLAELKAQGVAVVGISPDPVKRLKNFEQKQSLNFPLLADEDHSVAEAFGVWGLKKFMGREFDGIHRLSFLIGPDGTVRHRFDKFKTSDHHQVVLDWIKANG